MAVAVAGAMAVAVAIAMAVAVAVTVAVAVAVSVAVAMAVPGAVAKQLRSRQNDLDDSRIYQRSVVHGVPVAGTALRLLSLPAG